MRICVSIVCHDCGGDITKKEKRFHGKYDGQGRCVKCHEKNGKALYYFEDAVIIGDKRDFEAMAEKHDVTLTANFRNEICDWDPDREEIFAWVGGQDNLAAFYCELEGDVYPTWQKKKKTYQYLTKLKVKEAKEFAID